MFGIFATNKALRTRIAALHVRNDSANATIANLRKLLKEERDSRKKMEAESLRTIEMMSRRLINAGLMRPKMTVEPAVPTFKMPTRFVTGSNPMIDHGASSPDLGDMMLGGLMSQPGQQRED